MNKLPVLSLLFYSFTSYALAQSGIDFQDLEWTEALQAAKAKNKLLFVSAYVDWSEPCEELEKYIYTDQEVGDFYNENFINIRMDMETFPGVELTEYYEIYAFPSFLYINGFGQMVHRGCGALESAEFLDMGKAALSDKRIMDYQKKFTDGERSRDFLVEYSYILGEACMSKDDFVKRYFETTSQKEWLSEASWAMINLNISDPYSDQFQYLMSYYDMFALKYGKDIVDQKIYDVLLGQFIDIYEDADFTLFAIQALRNLVSKIDFNQKDKLSSMVNLKYADMKEDWKLYAESAVKIVKEQQVTDPDRLNEFAWKFYLFVDGKEKLELAIEWMEQVISDYADATYLDSYASLLYKLGRQKEAIKYSRKAFQVAEFERQDLMHYKAQLHKFESGY